MTRKILLSTVAAIAMLQPLAAVAENVTNSPVNSITLSSGGLAEIRRTATLDGNGEIRIEVPLDQVNDILKSLVVFDPQGTVKDLSLAGPNPLDETFKNLPFTPEDLTALPKLLTSLKGSKVTIEGRNKGVGTILGVETEKRSEGAEATFLNLLGEDGLISRYELDGASTVKFDDPAVRAKIASAVAVVGSNVKPRLAVSADDHAIGRVSVTGELEFSTMPTSFQSSPVAFSRTAHAWSILTVYDSKGAYIGDSSLLGLPNGDTRMSSFALDKKVNVETKTNSGIKTVEIKVVDGVLVTKNVMREETTYVIHGAADAERTVLIEHPKRDGWEFQSPDLNGESASDYRLKVKVAKGETHEVKAVLTRAGGESYQLADLNAADLAQWSSTSLDPVIKDKLSELSRAKKDEFETRRQLERAAEDHNALQASQERTRENLKVIPAGTDRQNEYVEKLSEIEEKIDQNEATQTQMRETLSKFTSRVDDIIRTF
ncbi:hypothetical protein HFN89_04415 [Rhizobium laguerreae]|nr:hypothetical protein [Rhizobium laguerreae]